MQKFLPIKIIMLLGIVFMGQVPSALAAPIPAVTGTDNLEATINVPLAITDVQISGRTGTVPVKLLVTNGTLAMSTITGLTFTGDQTGAEIYFSGNVTDVNAALATLSYTRASTGSDSLEVSLVEPGEVFFLDNNHLYEYIAVGGGITWTAAQSAAALLERYGSTGYLVTITSEEENDFVAARLEGAGWMGARDVVEDQWTWVTGPETGDLFWVGDQFGAVNPGEYENWNFGEPNDSGSNEDCAQFLSGGGQTGQWNDLPCTVTTLPGYVVEFGADGDLPETVGNDFAITTYNAPLAIAYLPEDGATRVIRSTNLVVTFGTAVEVGTGNITIHRASNDAIVATIDVASGQVTGSGTDTITINPTQVLPGNTEVYVQIAATAFDAVAGGSFAGIANETTWTFTTKVSGDDAIVPITGQTLTVIRAQTSCDAAYATGTVQLRAAGATEYTLANDVGFVTSTWQALTDGEAILPWTFAANEGTTTVYAAVRNSAGFIVYTNAEATIVSSTCDEEDESTEEEDSTTGADEVLTGPSPWTGVVELITDTSGMTLIKGEHYDTVYLLEDGVRRPFTAEAIYFTWFADFDAVESVTDATLSTIPLGIPVLPKAETLVKIPSVAKVYVVIDSGEGQSLQYIPSESTAVETYGADWAAQVIDLDVVLFDRFVWSS